MTPSALYDVELFVPIGADSLDRARELLRRAVPLAEIARSLGVLPRDLDLALWRAIGGRR